jgi:hypothetical protein
MKNYFLDKNEMPGMGEIMVYKYHFCQGAKMYFQSFRYGLLRAKWL